ncbi:MAG: MFS transporter [Gemmataceae bacterium]
MLVKRWAKPEERGRSSSIVAFGGRVGGAFAPTLTTTIGKLTVGLIFAGAVIGETTVNWRGVFLLYGLAGVMLGIVFWFLVSDHPPSHAGTLTQDPGPDWHATPKPATAPNPFGRMLLMLAGNRGMWLFGLLQFCNNISWAFLVTLLPTYLKDADVEIGLRGRIQTGVLLTGMCGNASSAALRCRAVASGPRWGGAVASPP